MGCMRGVSVHAARVNKVPNTNALLMAASFRARGKLHALKRWTG
jgi:hypothetical protein